MFEKGQKLVQTIATKSQYAKLKGRSPCTVSCWLRDGKISRRALVGSGPQARIWVEQADRDLLLTLDPSQQAAQVRPIGWV